MTAAQHRVLTATKVLFHRLGHAPTLTEIGREAGVCLSVAHKHVQHLLADGYLLRDKYRQGLILVPASFNGFTKCENSHEVVFFPGKNCPVCRAKGQLAPPRQVSTSPSS